MTTLDRMVDIETYDNICTAAIASIGAVKFNIATREICDPFYVTIDPKSCKEYGLSFSADTLEWWKNQSPEARAALRHNNIHLVDALQQFIAWYGTDKGKVCTWGIFDTPILDHAFRKTGLQSPWKYWNAVECRTIADLLGVKIDRTSGTHHNSLQDAKTQAEFMIQILNPKEV
jgi:hypothetical protein